MGDVPRCIYGFRLHRPGLLKRSKHACGRVDSSDDEVDERFRRSRVWRAGRLYQLKPYAHLAVPRWTSVKRNVSQSDAAAARRASAAATSRRRRAYVRGASSRAPGAPRHNLLPRGSATGARGGAVASAAAAAGPG